MSRNTSNHIHITITKCFLTFLFVNYIITSRSSPEIHIFRCTLKCPAKFKRKPPSCELGFSVCIREFIFRSGLGFLFKSLSRIKVRRTLYDLYLSVFLARNDGEVYKKKATGHFVTLI